MEQVVLQGCGIGVHEASMHGCRITARLQRPSMRSHPDESEPAGSHNLPDTCKQWKGAAQHAAQGHEARMHYALGMRCGQLNSFVACYDVLVKLGPSHAPSLVLMRATLIVEPVMPCMAHKLGCWPEGRGRCMTSLRGQERYGEGRTWKRSNL